MVLAQLFDKPCFLGLLAVQVMVTVFYMTEHDCIFCPHSIT